MGGVCACCGFRLLPVVWFGKLVSFDYNIFHYIHNFCYIFILSDNCNYISFCILHESRIAFLHEAFVPIKFDDTISLNVIFRVYR